MGSHSLISEIFDRHRPNIVICETPDVIAHRVAQAVAYRHGVFTLGMAFNNLFGDGIAYFTFGCNRRSPWLEYFYRHQEGISAESWHAADALMQQLATETLHDAKFVEDHKRSIGRRTANLARVTREFRKSMSVPEHGAVKEGGIRQSQSTVAQSSSATHTADAALYFGLPALSAGSLDVHGRLEVGRSGLRGRTSRDQRPRAIRIAVKENPKGFGLRSRVFYARLLALSNVDLIYPLVSNDALIRHAAAILSIAGTVGMEGIALGKKVVILGRPAYDIYEGARTINHPVEIFDHLSDPSWNPDTLVSQRRAFLAAMAQSTFYLGPPQEGTPWPRGEDAGPNYARAVDQFLNFIEQTQFPVEAVAASL